MSTPKNINQVFIANPITTNAATDLMYFGQSPYGATNDAAMTYANFSAQFISSPGTVDNAVFITSATGVPEYLANSGTAGYVLTADASAPPSWQAGGGGGSGATPAQVQQSAFNYGLDTGTADAYIVDLSPAVVT